MSNQPICVVAILKNEKPFVHEWLFYHRLLGVDHFFIYDDDLQPTLESLLAPHKNYVTIINWRNVKNSFNSKNTQVAAYTHALENHISNFEWVAFIDGDEFIVLPAWNDNIHNLLDEFNNYNSISINWHVFGHNGYFENPQELITSALTRRMRLPSEQIKSISKVKSISAIDSAHFCRLKGGARTDLNHKRFYNEIYDGKTIRGHINHYQCRSYQNWMSRLQRGDVSTEEIVGHDQQWRYDEEMLQRKFVESIALDKNEFVDEYMLKFTSAINKDLTQLNAQALNTGLNG